MHKLVFSLYTIAAGLVAAMLMSGPVLAEPAPMGAKPPLPPLPPAHQDVMLRVDGQDISVQQYANFLSRHEASIVEETRTPEGKARLLRAMVGDLLLRKAMKLEGLLPNDGKEHKDKLPKAYAEFAEKHYPLPPPPDDKAARAYYDKNTSMLGLPATVRLSQIQLRFPKDATAEQKADVKARAEQALKRLDSGEAFDKVAAEVTENKLAKARNGDIGFIPREGDPWLQSAIKGLKVGQRTQLLESSVGYEILMLTDERPAIVAPFEQMKDRVIKAMQAIEQGKAQEAYVQKLAKKAKIEIVQQDLKPIFPKGVFPR